LLLGSNHYYGSNGYGKDFAKCYEYLTKAAEQNHLEAIYLLGHVLLYDLRKSKEAFELYLRASKLPHVDVPLVNSTLATLYAKGHGCERNETEARRCFERQKGSQYEEDKSVEDTLELGADICNFEKEHNLTTDDMTLNDRAERFLLADPEWKPESIAFLKDFRKAAEKKMEPCYAAILDANETIPRMIKLAEAGSVTAKKYLDSLMLSRQAVTCLRNKQPAEAFRLLVEAYRIWDIFFLPYDELVLLIRTLERFGDCDQDKNASFCKLLSVFNNDVKGATIFARRCIRLFPDEPLFRIHLSCLYAFVSDFSSSMEEINKALELEYRPTWVYLKAACMKFLIDERMPKSQIKKAIAIYEEYLEKSPKDDRKVVESLYSIGDYYSTMNDDRTAKVYWKRAQEAEKKRLPVLEPVESSYKLMSNLVLNDLLREKRRK
jgi:tetratricopeptide (TPR) repeat protein